MQKFNKILKGGKNKILNQNYVETFEHNADFENGVKQGNKENNIEIAKKMLYKGIEYETIMEITRLTMLELIKIK